MKNWPQKEQNEQRVAFIDEQLQFPLELLWVTDIGPVSLVSAPIVVDGMIYICSAKALQAVDLLTSNIMWHFDPQTPPPNNFLKNSPVFCAGRMFLADPMGVRYCLDASNGQLLWQNSEPRTPDETFCVFDNKLFATFSWAKGSRGCLALDLDGNLLWQFNTSERINMKGVAIKDGQLIFGDRSGYIWALDTMAGNVVWSININEDINFQPYNLGKEKLYLWSLPMIAEKIVLAQIHRVLFVALDFDTGKLLGHVRTGLLPVGCNGNRLIFFDKDKSKLCQIDIPTGQLQEALSSSVPNLVHAEASRALIVGDSYIVGINQPQGLFAYNVETGQLLWRFETELEGSGFSTAPVFADNKLVIGSDTGKLYCFG